MSREVVAGDHFSGVAEGYAEFRPRYPRALFEFVARVSPRRGRAWDCAAGTGQATVDLAEWFARAVGTDVSAAQIARAPRHERIDWLVASAEATPIAPASIDLTTVAQALHWLDHDRFYAEVRRVSSPGAVIAAWSYGSPTLDGDAGILLTEFSRVTIGPYWPAERRHVDEGYRTIPFPFERLDAPALSLQEHWTRRQLVGYVRTWSSVTRYRAAHRIDPVVLLEQALAEVWPEQDERRRVDWPLAIVAGRVST